MGRAPCCDKANVKRGPWSPEEDATLRSYIEKHGTGGNWIALPQKAGLKRCGKSCRLRWLNYLRPDIKHGGFTEEEDNIICSLYNKLGSRWSVIASHLTGRTDNDVKNYWNTKLKKKVMAAGQASLPSNTTTPPSSSAAHIYHSPSPTPSPNPSLLATIKSEAYACGSFSSLPLEKGLGTNFGFGGHDSQKLYSELAQFPAMGLVKQADYGANMTVSPSEDISAASSTITMDNNNSSCSNSYLNWSANGAGGDDGLLSDLGFGSFSEFLSVCGSNEKIGDPSPYYYSNMWVSSEAKPQGLYQSVTYS